MRLPAWFFILVAGSGFAADAPKLPLEVGTLKTRDGKVFEESKITGYDAVGVKLTHAGGVARVEFLRLPKALAERFPRDAEAAKEQREQEAAQADRHERAVVKGLKEQADEPEAERGGKPESAHEEDTGPLESRPELQGDVEARIASLEAYIRRLEAGCIRAEAAARRASELASKYRQSATYDVSRTYANGTQEYYQRTNRGRARRAEFQEKRAARESGKAGEGRQLIREAQEQINSLRQPTGL